VLEYMARIQYTGTRGAILYACGERRGREDKVYPRDSSQGNADREKKVTRGEKEETEDVTGSG